MNALAGGPRAAPGMMASGAQAGLMTIPVAEVLAIATLHEREGRLEPARALLDRILAAAPGHAGALHLAAVVAHRQDRAEDALALMQRAIAHGTDTPLYMRNIAELYRSTGRLDAAAAAARQAVALAPADPVAALNLGIVLADQRRTAEAEACLRRSLALDPRCAAAHFALAEVLLGRGDLAQGWEEYGWRFQLPGAAAQLPRTGRPVWTGAPLDGTLLLFADQGFGDGIQFGRYIAWAAARATSVSVACSAELRPILAQLAPEARLFSNWEKAGTFAAWATLSGLPRLAGTRLDTIPPSPKLAAEPALARRWRARLDALVAPGLRRVGLVWAGRPTHRNDRRRSAPLAELAPILDAAATALVVLQKGPSQAQVARHAGRAPLVHLSTEITGFQDTMAIIESLDLVVTVDTSVAHLAGAMGRPVWIMLPHAAEWRWLADRTDSPWYPSARLFRQAAAGDWRGVAARVAQELPRR